MGTRSTGWRGARHVAFTLALMAMLTVTASTPPREAAAASAEPPSPATGHAAIVAQQVVDIAGGAHYWSLAGGVVDAGTAVAHRAGAAGFVVATGGTLVAADDGGMPVARLGIGEATSLAADDDLSFVAVGGQPAAYVAVLLVAEDPVGVPTNFGTPFTLRSGLYDLDLVREVLLPGETSSLEADGMKPALLVLTAGSVTVAADDSIVLHQDDGLLVGGDVQVTNEGDGPAAYIAAVVGPIVDPQSLPAAATDGGGL